MTRASISRLGIFLPLLAGVLAISGCADLVGSDDSLRQDVAQLRQDVNSLMVSAQRSRGEAEAVAQIERRMRDQAAENAKQMDALAARIESLNSEVSRLSARLDSVSRKVDASGQQTPPVGSVPPRVSMPFPSSSSGTSSNPAPAETPRGGTTASAESTAQGGSAQETYQAAYVDFTKGHYELAIPAFREFIRRFPDSPLADSAQYNIGESYFSMARSGGSSGQADRSRQDLEQAVQEFRKVIVNYPRGSKVPTALYKEALALTELKQPALAQARLQYLLEHFPQSEEAPLAKERLAALKQ